MRKQDAVAVARADMQLSDIANARAVRKLATELVPAWVALGNRSAAERA
jgi:hypothetical protein